MFDACRRGGTRKTEKSYHEDDVVKREGEDDRIRQGSRMLLQSVHESRSIRNLVRTTPILNREGTEQCPEYFPVRLRERKYVIF